MATEARLESAYDYFDWFKDHDWGTADGHRVMVGAEDIARRDSDVRKDERCRILAALRGCASVGLAFQTADDVINMIEMLPFVSDAALRTEQEPPA